MSGLDVDSKKVRVKNYQKKTVDSALDIIGAMGHTSSSEVTPADVMKRVAINRVATFEELYPVPQVKSFTIDLHM